MDILIGLRKRESECNGTRQEGAQWSERQGSMSGRFLSKVGGFPWGVRAAEYGLRVIYVVLATSRDRFPYKNEKARLCCDPLAQWSDGVMLVVSSQYQSFDRG